MPPASRGTLTCVHVTRSRAQLCSRRNISIQKPRDPRNFPTQARSRFRAEKDAVPQPGPENEGRRSRSFIPQFLKSRPFLRTSIYSFFITVPISGFLLMHLPIEPRRVTGPSMKPTINPDCESEHDTNYSPTYVLVQTFNPNRALEKRRSIEQEGWAGYYKRGDLIVYQTPHDPDKVALKRVVGVPADTVVPLKGYEGGDEPVTIQYYQLWVEGDVNDRKKSIDSNYFGPISEALVRGKVIAMWSPWWNIFEARMPDKTLDDWPAKRQGRVAERAVYLAATNPDRIGYLDLFRSERAGEFLRKLRHQSAHMKELFDHDENFRGTLRYYREHGTNIANSKDHPELQETAQTILLEMERTFGKERLDSLTKSSKAQLKNLDDRVLPTSPTSKAGPVFSNTTVHKNEQSVLREARERPAKTALEDMMKQTRQMAEMKEKEMEERQRNEI